MNSDQALKEALSQCDRQPIHLISSIQNYGFFLAFNPADRKIAMVSENISELYGKSAIDIVGGRIENYLEAEDIKFLLDFSKKPGHQTITTRISGPEGRDYEGLVYESGGLIIIELDEVPEKYNSLAKLSELQSQNRSFSEELSSQTSLEKASKLLCRYIRSLTGMDRVMLYRFLPNWDGEVLAEDKTPEAHSFNRHRFPSSDIPLPARQLYLQNRTRLIPDATLGSVALYPARNPLTNTLLDMTPSKIRAVPEVHLEYLKNMGVRSSFSVAVVHEGRLWGLVACHNTKPTKISLDVRTACEVLANTFGGLARHLEQGAVDRRRLQFESGLRELVQKVIVKSDPLDAFFRQHQQVCDLFKSSGMALVSSDKVSLAGLTPPESYIKTLIPQIKPLFGPSSESVVTFESLREFKDEWAEIKSFASGVMALALPGLKNSFFLLFRPEFLGEITWGGDPRKTLAKRDYQGPINPRLSFESWTQSVHSRSTPWESHEVEGMEYLRDVIFEGIVRRDHLLQELAQQLARKV